MRIRKTFVLVLLLSLLIAVESASLLPLIRGATALFNKSLWSKILRTVESPKYSRFNSQARNDLRKPMRDKRDRLQIGDVVEGISQLQDYFELFGYLNSTLNSNFTDVFSDDVESAIERFQKTFNLNVTGQPDNETLSLIFLPRCSLPDFINGSSTVLDNRTTSFAQWWEDGKKEISYAFSPEVKTSTSFKDAFADAFQWWSNKTTLNFTEMTSFNEADIQIMFLPLDGDLGVVGGAWFDNKTKKWNVVLDSDEKWVVQTEDMKKSDDLYLEPEVIHQIGHVLGLNHSAIKQDNMYPLIQTQSSDGGGGGGVGLRWGLVSTLRLGVTLLFWL